MAHEGQKIKGDLWFLKLKRDAEVSFLTLICQKDFSLTQSTDSIDATSKCGDDSAPGKKTKELSGDFYIIQGANVQSTEASLKLLQDYFDDSEKLDFTFGPQATTLATGALRYEGSAWLNKLDIKAPTEGYVEASCAFKLYASETTLVEGS